MVATFREMSRLTGIWAAATRSLFPRLLSRTFVGLSAFSGAAASSAPHVVADEAADLDALHDNVMESHRGEVIVIVGHSNTVPELIRLFSGTEVPAIPEDEYANLYVVTIPWFGKSKVLRLAFGEPG